MKEKLVKEKLNENDGIPWSGKNPTKQPIIGVVIPSPFEYNGHTYPSEEVNVVEIVKSKSGDIYIVDMWNKPGVPQLIHSNQVEEYIPKEDKDLPF